MAHVHGIAGEWARVRGTVNGLRPLFVSLFALGFSVAAIVFGHYLLGMALTLIFACFSVRFLLSGEKRMESYFKGALGEEHVSRVLVELPEDYHIFNDFVACGNHVDHVVVGPTGVFAVETKFWRGKVTLEEDHILLGGQLPDRSPLAQARNEAEYVRHELKKIGWPGSVVAYLVFASDTFALGSAESRGVTILNLCSLIKHMTSSRVVLASEEVERLVSLMENKR